MNYKLFKIDQKDELDYDPDRSKCYNYTTLIPQFYEVFHKVPKQMEMGKLSKLLDITGEKLEIATDTVSLTMASLNIFQMSSLTYLWGLISSLQLVLYLSVISEPFPSNIDSFYKFFFKLQRIDYLPPDLAQDIFHFS